MKDIPELQGRNELAAWVKQNFDNAVKELIRQNLIDGLMIEAKPAWVFPFKTIIGKARVKDQPGDFLWFICGDVPFDRIAGSAAATPREAARHFALKWQLDASREGELDSELVFKANALYQLTEDERIWIS